MIDARFLQNAKEKIKHNELVTFTHHQKNKEYKIVLSKRYFAIYENKKLVLKNYLERIKCDYFDRLIINPFSKKRVILTNVSKELCDWYENNDERERIGDFLTSLKGIVGDFLPLVILFGSIGVFRVLDAYYFGHVKHDYIFMGIVTIVIIHKFFIVRF